MNIYRVVIYRNLKQWGEYQIIALNRESALFLAGMKYATEEQRIGPGEMITADAIPFDYSGE